MSSFARRHSNLHGETCHLILKALEERSNRAIEKEVLSYKPRPYKSKEKPVERNVNTFSTGDKFKIGSLEVEPIIFKELSFDQEPTTKFKKLKSFLEENKSMLENFVQENIKKINQLKNQPNLVKPLVKC